MSTPFTISGNMAFPPDAGLPVMPLPLAINGQYDNEGGGAPLTLIGSGTFTVDLGTVLSLGVKGLMIKVDKVSPTPNSTPGPVNLRFNGGGAQGQLELSPGGGLIYGNPDPVAGITALVVAYTTDVRLRVWALS